MREDEAFQKIVRSIHLKWNMEEKKSLRWLKKCFNVEKEDGCFPLFCLLHHKYKAYFKNGINIKCCFTLAKKFEILEPNVNLLVWYFHQTRCRRLILILSLNKLQVFLIYFSYYSEHYFTFI